MNWWMLLGMAAITFANRYAFFAAAVDYQPGEKARRFLSYSSYSVLTAIWMPIIFQYNPQSGLSHAGYDYLIAGTAAALLSILRVRSIYVVVMSAGVFFGLRLLVF